jgi:hypothetical protein
MGGAAGMLACSSGVPPADGPVDEGPKTDVRPAPTQPPPAQPVATQPAPVAPAPTPPPVVATTPPPQPKPAVTQPAPVTPAPTPPPPVVASPPPPPPQPTWQPIGVTPPSCVIKGTHPVTKGTQLFDAPTGGRVIANFIGNYVPMQLSDIPPDPVNSRSKLATSNGGGAIRLEGFVATSVIPVYTTRDIPVMAGNVWITSAQKASLVAATSSSVIIEMVVAGSRNQRVRGTTTCDALALQRGTPVPIEVPGNGRGYLTKESTIDIYSQPNGDVVFSLMMLEGSSQLFWSTETRAGFVHVNSRADLAIDGWVRWKDLDPLKKGEMMDQYIPPQSAVVGGQLAMDKPPRIATATKDILIRARRDERERPIGVVESGAEFYVMETVAGWTNVLPKALHILPPDDGGFWVVSSEVPK